MMRTCLYQNNRLSRGHEEQIERWESDPEAKLWIDLCGEPETETRELFSMLGFHELAIADALRTRHPPKIEHFDGECFLVYLGYSSCEEQLDIKTVQIAFFVNDRLLVSLRHGESIGINTCWTHEKLENWFTHPSHILSRILNRSARAYLETLLLAEEELAAFEDAMLERPDDELMYQLTNYRTQLRRLLRTFDYHHRVIKDVMEGVSEFIPVDDEETVHVFKDVADKFERLESLANLFYDLCGDMIDGYISLSSHRLNQTMQVLTVITAIFVPLGLMAGIYGMNFENMPELHLEHGYYFIVSVMFVTAVTMLFIFKRKGWI